MQAWTVLLAFCPTLWLGGALMRPVAIWWSRMRWTSDTNSLRCTVRSRPESDVVGGAPLLEQTCTGCHSSSNPIFCCHRASSLPLISSTSVGRKPVRGSWNCCRQSGVIPDSTRRNTPSPKRCPRSLTSVEAEWIGRGHDCPGHGRAGASMNRIIDNPCAFSSVAWSCCVVLTLTISPPLAGSDSAMRTRGASTADANTWSADGRSGSGCLSSQSSRRFLGAVYPSRFTSPVSKHEKVRRSSATAPPWPPPVRCSSTRWSSIRCCIITSCKSCGTSRPRPPLPRPPPRRLRTWSAGREGSQTPSSHMTPQRPCASTTTSVPPRQSPSPVVTCRRSPSESESPAGPCERFASRARCV
mmetsp:Transcript_5095/g.11933  ORF Transcript_5095/g.11933 Transcript_5095/m.11933 type:complete len:356 (-) Transcript_5095:1678-2745(-)